MIRAILLSDAFQSTWGEKIKRPFEFTVGMFRATQGSYTSYDDLSWRYEQTGHSLYEWAAPTGYPDEKEVWSSTVPMLQRWRLSTWLIDSWQDENDNYYIDLISQTPGHLQTANELVDFWVNRILGRPLEDSNIRTELVEFVADGRNPDSPIPASDELLVDRIRSLVISIINSPDFQWR